MSDWLWEGIDVSWCQTRVDWQKVAKAGIRFVMIRAGFCYNDGTLKEDKMLRSHVQGAQAAGLEVGFYLYSYALTPQAARTAAQQTAALVAPYKPTFPVAFDLEDPSLERLGRDTLTQTAAAFCQEMEQQGFYAMIYANKDWLTRLLDTQALAAHDVWLAQWASQPSWDGSFGLWQYAGSQGRVDGVSGPCDRDRCRRDYPAIIRSAGLNGWTASQPEPEPEPEEPDWQARCQALQQKLDAIQAIVQQPLP